MPEFAHPSWWPLWLGLLIPLIIHLWNRREGSALKVGSVKWIPEVEERKLNSWKFTDFWRYLLRSLLLIILAVLTLQLLWPSQTNTEKANKWLLLDTDLPASPALGQWIDSLQLNGYEAHWLTITFPLVQATQSEEPPMTNADADIWTLLELLAAQPDRPDSLWLLTSAKLQHIQGQRPVLPFHLQLQSLPAEQPKAYLAKAWKTNEQEAQVLIGWSNENQLKFESYPLLLQENQQILADTLPPLQV
ncbi:MAG: BatA domain-containing protein, partial [Saprospiraceae bacterium]|nr:BatA domain-containing protein [Saprospiraceae bacterium]